MKFILHSVVDCISFPIIDGDGIGSRSRKRGGKISIKRKEGGGRGRMTSKVSIKTK
jgi:hypothetical protein